MSGIFSTINEEADRQRKQANHMSTTNAKPQKDSADLSVPEEKPPASATDKKEANQKESGTTAPPHGTTAPQTLDRQKLVTVIQELSQMPTNSNGLNVRMSAKEAEDVEEFIHGTLRRQGLKGNHVSAAKLMRYAFRYVYGVHRKEFIAALEEALKIDDNLSI